MSANRDAAKRREGARRRVKLAFSLDGRRYEVESWYPSPEEGRRDLAEYVKRRWPEAVVLP